jgi:hypothetical protein
MSVAELKSTPSASTTAIRNSTQASTSNKNRDGKKYRNNGKRWFQKQNAGGEEREAGSVGDCWACGSSLEVCRTKGTAFADRLPHE